MLVELDRGRACCNSPPNTSEKCQRECQQKSAEKLTSVQSALGKFTLDSREQMADSID